MVDILVKDLKVSPCELSEIKVFIEKHHYSKSINGVKCSYCFKVEHNNTLVGAVLYGMMSTTAWKKFGVNESDVLELRRLVLVDDAPKNSESRVISKTLKWIKKNARYVHIVVSYADPTYGHTGVVYRASNFEYVGKSAKDKGYEDIETGKVYHSRALRTKYKGEYKPFVKRLRVKLAEGVLVEISLEGKYCYTYRLRNNNG